MKIVCNSCSAKYSIADEKVAGRVFKIRCKKCGAAIVVRGDEINVAQEEDDSTRVVEYGGEGVWHIVIEGEQQGPYTPAQIGDMLAAGSIQWDAYVWREGYEDGSLRGDVYPDVPATLVAWRDAGGRVAIYSSGSVLAQRLLFGHSTAGDLMPLIDAYFDTGVGHKREVASYHAITAELDIEASAILFVSDVVAELDAARDAGLQTRLSLRPGNPEVEPGHGHAEVRSLAELGPPVRPPAG